MSDTIRPRSSLGGFDVRVNKSDAPPPQPAVQSAKIKARKSAQRPSSRRPSSTVGTLYVTIKDGESVDSKFIKRAKAKGLVVEFRKARVSEIPNPHAGWLAAFDKFGIDPQHPDALELALVMAMLELGRAAPDRFPEFAHRWPHYDECRKPAWDYEVKYAMASGLSQNEAILQAFKTEQGLSEEKAQALRRGRRKGRRTLEEQKLADKFNSFRTVYLRRKLEALIQAFEAQEGLSEQEVDNLRGALKEQEKRRRGRRTRELTREEQEIAGRFNSFRAAYGPYELDASPFLLGAVARMDRADIVGRVLAALYDITGCR